MDKSSQKTDLHGRLLEMGESCLPIEPFKGFLSKTDLDKFRNFFLYSGKFRETSVFI